MDAVVGRGAPAQPREIGGEAEVWRQEEQGEPAPAPANMGVQRRGGAEQGEALRAQQPADAALDGSRPAGGDGFGLAMKRKGSVST